MLPQPLLKRPLLRLVYFVNTLCMLLLMVCCEDFKLDASDGTRQISTAAGSDACHNSGNTQEVVWPVEVAD